MHRSHKIFALKLFVFSLSSCGIDQSSHFDNKTFGNSNRDSTSENSGESSGTSTPQDPGRPPPPNHQDQGPEQAHDSILSHYSFKGFFNEPSVRRIALDASGSSGTIPQGTSTDLILGEILGYIKDPYGIESMAMLARENGPDRNVMSQRINSDTGDKLAAFQQADSQSGKQTLDWVPGAAGENRSCPGPFVCIQRMLWQPNSGEAMTYCYRELDSDALMPIPYAPNPQFSRESFVEALEAGIKTKPFRVFKYHGDIQCETPPKPAVQVIPVVYDLSLQPNNGASSKPEYRFATHKPLAVDAIVKVKFSLFNPQTQTRYIPAKGPFVDQLVRLATQTKFYLNQKVNVITKIDRTIQTPFDLRDSHLKTYLEQNYGARVVKLAQWLIDGETPTIGLQVNYQLEFCKNLGTTFDPYNHCTGTF